MPNREHEQFVQQMIASQGRLHALVLAMTANADAADDVLQETNLVLLRKEHEFQPGTSFIAWSAQVAAFQVKNYRSKQSRDRLQFDDTLVAQLASQAGQFADATSLDRTALRECLEGLDPSERELIRERYAGTSVQQLAAQRDRSPASISQSLYRTRGKLADCVRRVLAREANS